MTILFWNLNKRADILGHLGCLVRAYSVDVFLLAECPEGLGQAIEGLNVRGAGMYREVRSDAKVTAVTRLGPRDFVLQYAGLAGRIAVWSIRGMRGDKAELLLAGVHLTSKSGGTTDGDQLVEAVRVIEELCEEEDRHEHRNTIIVGDFNMNPYDPGMTSVAGVHGLMTRRLAERPDRVHDGRPYRRFYNPMWGYLGDRTPGPAGSHYWTKSVLHNQHWQMFDQVLVRPGVIERLETVRILDHDGSHSLIRRNGRPDAGRFSDHLPIVFALDL